MSDEVTSAVSGVNSQFPTEGPSLEYLPTNRKQGANLVASIFFPTDVPNDQGFEYVRNPEQYLSDDDVTALETLLGSEELMGKSSPADDQRVGQLMSVGWKFEGYADQRASAAYNKRLAARRAQAVAGYLVKFVKKFDPNYSQHWILVPSKSKFAHDWRWQVCANIVNSFHGISRSYGEDRSRGEEATYPYYRRVDIRATSADPFNDPNAIPQTCSGFTKNESYWRWGSKDQVKKPPYKVQKLESNLKNRIDQTYQKHVKGTKKSKLKWYDKFPIGSEVRKAIYCYRYQRMILHELFRGSWDPSQTLRSDSGRSGTAAADLLCSGSTACQNELLSVNPFEAGSSIQNAAHNTALQLEHMYLVRSDPFYRATYLREFPGKNPEEKGSVQIPFLPGAQIKASWIADRANMEPAENWDFWPTEMWANLDAEVKQKVKKRGIIPNPAQNYQTGKEHNRGARKFGSYDYTDYRFIRGDLDPETSQQWSNTDISGKLKQYNGGYDGSSTSHVKHVRDAVRTAQTIVKDKANQLVSGNEPDFYDIYLEEWRTPEGKPDYTDPAEWNKWKNPTPP